MGNVPAHKIERRARRVRKVAPGSFPAAILARPQPDRDGFLEFKALLRKKAARTFDALLSRSWPTASQLSQPRNARHYFEAAGYDPE